MSCCSPDWASIPVLEGRDFLDVTGKEALEVPALTSLLPPQGKALRRRCWKANGYLWKAQQLWATATQKFWRPACTFSDAAWHAGPETSCSREHWQSSPPHQPAMPPQEKDGLLLQFKPCPRLCRAGRGEVCR